MQRPLQKLFFMFLFFPLHGIGQVKNSGDSLSISFLMKDTVIVDTSQLKLKIIYRNTTSRAIDVYRELQVSDHGVNNGNISYEVKCLDDKEWGWRSHCAPAICSPDFIMKMAVSGVLVQHQVCRSPVYRGK